MREQGVLQGALIWVARKLADLNSGDATEGQLDVAKGVAALHAKDWAALSALYANRSPSDRYHFLQGLANVCKLECETPAASAEFASITAGLTVGWAWRHRGYGVGSTVTESGARNMWRLLEQTVRLVNDLGACADSVALACAIRATMALDGSRGDLQRYLNAAEQLGEPNIFVPRNHLRFVAPNGTARSRKFMRLRANTQRSQQAPRGFRCRRWPMRKRSCSACT